MEGDLNSKTRPGDTQFSTGSARGEKKKGRMRRSGELFFGKTIKSAKTIQRGNSEGERTAYYRYKVQPGK